VGVAAVAVGFGKCCHKGAVGDPWGTWLDPGSHKYQLQPATSPLCRGKRGSAVSWVAPGGLLRGSSGGLGEGKLGIGSSMVLGGSWQLRRRPRGGQREELSKLLGYVRSQQGDAQEAVWSKQGGR